jgi:hypothetical protein
MAFTRPNKRMRILLRLLICAAWALVACALPGSRQAPPPALVLAVPVRHFDVDGVERAAAVQMLGKWTGVRIEADWPALVHLGIGERDLVDLRIESASLGTTVKAIFATRKEWDNRDEFWRKRRGSLDDVHFEIHPGSIRVSSESAQPTVVRIYDISEIVEAEHVYRVAEWQRDSAALPPGSGYFGNGTTRLDCAKGLADAIAQSIFPDLSAFGAPLPAAQPTVNASERFLFAVMPPSTQREIAALLAASRQTHGHRPALHRK